MAAWLEAPVGPAAPVTGMDLVANDQFDLLLRLLTDGVDGAAAVLDEFEPGLVRGASR